MTFLGSLLLAVDGSTDVGGLLGRFCGTLGRICGSMVRLSTTRYADGSAFLR